MDAVKLGTPSQQALLTLFGARSGAARRLLGVSAGFSGGRSETFPLVLLEVGDSAEIGPCGSFLLEETLARSRRSPRGQGSVTIAPIYHGSPEDERSRPRGSGLARGKALDPGVRTPAWRGGPGRRAAPFTGAVFVPAARFSRPVRVPTRNRKDRSAIGRGRPQRRPSWGSRGRRGHGQTTPRDGERATGHRSGGGGGSWRAARPPGAFSKASLSLRRRRESIVTRSEGRQRVPP